MTESALVRYDAACQALSAAKRTDEVLKIRNEHEALRAYAKQAKNRQMEIDATEIRIRAERRVGELMKAQKLTNGLARGGQPYKRKNSTGGKNPPVEPTLADAGIDKDLAKTARKLAAVPEKQFERMMDDWREHADHVAARLSMQVLPKRQPRSRPKAKLQRADLAESFPSAAARAYFRVSRLISDELEQLEAIDQLEMLDILDQAIRDLKQQRLEVSA